MSDLELAKFLIEWFRAHGGYVSPSEDMESVVLDDSWNFMELARDLQEKLCSGKS